MKEKVLELIKQQFNIKDEEISRETSFRDDLNADSIELVELIMSIEEEFDITVDDEKLQGIKTIGDVLDYIDQIA